MALPNPWTEISSGDIVLYDDHLTDLRTNIDYLDDNAANVADDSTVYGSQFTSDDNGQNTSVDSSADSSIDSSDNATINASADTAIYSTKDNTIHGSNDVGYDGALNSTVYSNKDTTYNLNKYVVVRNNNCSGG